jgi:hypothetical protein
LLLSYLFLVYQFKVRPFYDYAQNEAQVLALSGICMTTFSALLLKSFACNPARALEGGADIVFFRYFLVVSNVAVMAKIGYNIFTHGLLKEGIDYVTKMNEVNEQKKKRMAALENANLVLAANAPKEQQVTKKVVKQEIVQQIPVFTSDVNIEAVFQEANLARVMSTLLDSEKVKSIAKQGRISGECFTSSDKAALVSQVEANVRWYFDRFETERHRLLRDKASRDVDFAWPPKCVQGYRYSKETFPLALKAAGEADLVKGIEKKWMDEALTIAQSKFPEYCPEVTEMKAYLRKATRSVAQAVVQGLKKFKEELDRIHSEAKCDIADYMDDELYDAAKETFNRVSADGEALAEEEELTNMMTALEFKFDGFLNIPAHKDKLLAHAFENKLPMKFPAFWSWFNQNFSAEAQPTRTGTVHGGDDVAPLAVTSALGSFEAIGGAGAYESEDEESLVHRRPGDASLAPSDRGKSTATFDDATEATTVTEKTSSTAAPKMSAARAKLSGAIRRKKMASQMAASAASAASPSPPAEGGQEEGLGTIVEAAPTPPPKQKSAAARMLEAKRKQRQAKGK